MKMDIVESKHVIDFVTVAKEYCMLVTENSIESKKEFLETMQKLVTLIYLKASLLPKLEAVLDEDLEKIVKEEDWLYVDKKIATLLGEHNPHFEVKDSILSHGDEALNVWLSEVFADIYQELANFLHSYQIGIFEIMNDGLHECQRNFESYWGVRLLGGLNQIHRLLFYEESLNDEENQN